MENANLARSLKQTYYRLSQRYGVVGSIFKRTEADVDFVTGKTTQTVESRKIRKIVRVAVAGDERQVTYTASMMRSLRPFAWQGSGRDVKMAVFLIYANELRGWDITPSQWIRYDNRNWHVKSALQNQGGWIIEAKLSEGEEDGYITTVESDVSVDGETSETVE